MDEKCFDIEKEKQRTIKRLLFCQEADRLKELAQEFEKLAADARDSMQHLVGYAQMVKELAVKVQLQNEAFAKNIKV